MAVKKPVMKILCYLLLLCVIAGDGASNSNTQQFIGIGVRLKLSNGGVLLEQVFQESPAEKAGLQRGEVILEVDGKSILGLPLQETVAQLQGQEGSRVRLRVAGVDGTTRDVVVTPDFAFATPVLSVNTLVQLPLFFIHIQNGSQGFIRIRQGIM